MMPIFISKDEAGDPRNRLHLSQLVSPLVRGGQVRDGVYSGIRLLAMALACASLAALTEFSNPVEAAGRGKNLSARGSVPIRFSLRILNCLRSSAVYRIAEKRQRSYAEYAECALRVQQGHYLPLCQPALDH